MTVKRVAGKKKEEERAPICAAPAMEEKEKEGGRWRMVFTLTICFALPGEERKEKRTFERDLAAAWIGNPGRKKGGKKKTAIISISLI